MHVFSVLGENVRKNDFKIKFCEKTKLEIRREASIWENMDRILINRLFNESCSSEKKLNQRLSGIRKVSFGYATPAAG